MDSSHNSFDHLQAIILCALQLCDRPYMDESEKEDRMTEMTAAFQQLKDDELEAIQWEKLKGFLNSLEINLV